MLLGGSLHVLYVESNALLGEYVLCAQAVSIPPIHRMLSKSIPGTWSQTKKRTFVEKQMF